ncbi:MAG: DUF6364 family protein [Anaerovoracaceae bacterium]|nr:DUF6364 family protein [Bacillota bacterium]MDY2671229.1 DUF6364 family protein [Anaerovoracaceae bacterium]
MAKTKVNLSLDPDVAERLKQYAYERHMTVSAVVTAWTLNAKVEHKQIRGQVSLFEKKR